jgi:hypothetical protein
MTDIAAPTTIRLRPLIRYLGGLLGFVAGAPSVFGCAYLLLHPVELVSNSFGPLFPLVLGPLIAWSTWKWWTICGTIGPEQVVLRGWFKTTIVERSRIEDVRRVYTEALNLEQASNRTWHYELFDAEGHSLGRVPDMVQACQGWDQFLERLRQAANSHGDREPS